MSYSQQSQSMSKAHRSPHLPKRESYSKNESETTNARYKEFTFMAPDDAASLVSRLENPRSFLNAAADTDRVKLVEKLFHKGAAIGVGIWLVLMFVVYLVSPNDSYVEPAGFDQLCHVVCGTLLVVANGARLLPMILKEKGYRILKSGFIVGSLSVQLVALASNYIMAFRPTPVIYDEISGLHFHMVRWAEFTALAFLMAFLTVNVDAPFKGSGSHAPKVNFVFPSMMALSTSAGMIFPFCPNEYLWWTIMAISWSLFFTIYVVTFQKVVDYLELKGELKAGSAKAKANAQQAERLEIAKSSFNLCLSISISWTMLALIFTFLGVVTKLARKDSWVSNPHLLVAVTCVFEVISKIWYLGALFEAYRKVFDEQVRGRRRLEELRSFMSAVWLSSSDVIVFCSKNGGIVNAKVSPAFINTLAGSADALGLDPDDPASLMLEIDASQDVFSVSCMDLDQAITQSDISSVQTENLSTRTYRISKAEDINAPEVNLARMAKLALDAVTLAPALLDSRINPTKFVADAGRKGFTATEMSCEVHISLLESRSCVLTLRDISERLHRFQVEKKLVEEVTSRKKDEEANRFTRHEVKNALLAAMGILDHLRDLMQRSNVLPKRNTEGMIVVSETASMSFLDIGGDDDSVSPQTKEVEATFNELDATLKDVMDTILDEAMAREIIYGHYTPRKERINVPDVLASLRRGASRRFPLDVVPPGPLFPVIDMDRQLLRYIYRNAISNACKFGRKDGVVSTRVNYDSHLQLLTMQIINLPGVGHEKLCKLSAAEAEKIFDKNTKLKATQESENDRPAANDDSTGNGAWIMMKCAEAMNGRLDIKFEKTRTVFSFSCACSPVFMPERQTLQQRPIGSVNMSSSAEFVIPDGTWGVVIDDSRIQRKVLGTFMQLIGIDRSRQVVLGASKDEIHGFGKSVQRLLKENPNDKFILIVDENLDIVDGGTRHETVSGSISVQNLLSELDPDSKSRVLALIRSANDSDMDIQVYKKRAHGHLRKEPLQKTGNLELIKPWWLERFGGGNPMMDDSSFNNSLEFGVADDVRESLSVISALAVVASDARWQAIREKLHGLKGDLKATMPMATIGTVVNELDRLMAQDKVPRDFSNKWLRLESEIESILAV